MHIVIPEIYFTIHACLEKMWKLIIRLWWKQFILTLAFFCLPNFGEMKIILSALCGSLASHNYCCPSSLHDALLATLFLMMHISAALNIFLKQTRMKTFV